MGSRAFQARKPHDIQALSLLSPAGFTSLMLLLSSNCTRCCRRTHPVSPHGTAKFNGSKHDDKTKIDDDLHRSNLSLAKSLFQSNNRSPIYRYHLHFSDLSHTKLEPYTLNILHPMTLSTITAPITQSTQESVGSFDCRSQSQIL